MFGNEHLWIHYVEAARAERAQFHEYPGSHERSRSETQAKGSSQTFEACTIKARTQSDDGTNWKAKFIGDIH